MLVPVRATGIEEISLARSECDKQKTCPITFKVMFLTPHLPNVLSGLFLRHEINPMDMENIPCGASGSEIIRAFRQMERSVLTQRIFSTMYLHFNTLNYCYFKKSITGYFNLTSFLFLQLTIPRNWWRLHSAVLSSAGVGWERPLLEHSGDRILSSAAGAANSCGRGSNPAPSR